MQSEISKDTISSLLTLLSWILLLCHDIFIRSVGIARWWWPVGPPPRRSGGLLVVVVVVRVGSASRWPGAMGTLRRQSRAATKTKHVSAKHTNRKAKL
jgi:hypothetical protein